MFKIEVDFTYQEFGEGFKFRINNSYLFHNSAEAFKFTSELIFSMELNISSFILFNNYFRRIRLIS